MATFWTKTEIDLDVNEIYENLSDREILQLVDLLVEENLVISTNTIKSESINFLDDEWRKTLMAPIETIIYLVFGISDRY